MKGLLLVEERPRATLQSSYKRQVWEVPPRLVVILGHRHAAGWVLDDFYCPCELELQFVPVVSRQSQDANVNPILVCSVFLLGSVTAILLYMMCMLYRYSTLEHVVSYPWILINRRNHVSELYDDDNY